MANIATAVIQGSGVALNLVRQFLSYPSITYVPVINGVLGTPQTVLMQVEGFRELLANQVSKMLLIDISKGKSFISDNNAPLPRVWQMEGYLFPLISVLPIIDQISLEILKQTLRDASDSRQLVQFKPVVTSVLSQFSQGFQSIASGSITGTVPVMILDIEFSLSPVILNKAPFKMTVQKIDQLSAVLNAGNNVVASPDGTLNNPAARPASNTQGNTASTSIPVAVP